MVMMAVGMIFGCLNESERAGIPKSLVRSRSPGDRKWSGEVLGRCGCGRFTWLGLVSEKCPSPGWSWASERGTIVVTGFLSLTIQP